MHKEEYSALDGLGLAQLIKQGEVTPTELLAAAQSLLKEKNTSLNAMVLSMDAQATKTIEAGLPSGAFTGVPFALKDLGMQYKGVVTSNGSRLFSDSVATHDSTLVQRYKAAGLVICGKSNTPEFGLATTTEPVLFGPTHNPWKHVIPAVVPVAAHRHWSPQAFCPWLTPPMVAALFAYPRVVADLSV